MGIFLPPPENNVNEPFLPFEDSDTYCVLRGDTLYCHCGDGIPYYFWADANGYEYQPWYCFLKGPRYIKNVELSFKEDVEILELSYFFDGIDTIESLKANFPFEQAPDTRNLKIFSCSSLKNLDLTFSNADFASGFINILATKDLNSNVNFSLKLKGFKRDDLNAEAQLNLNLLENSPELGWNITIEEI